MGGLLRWRSGGQLGTRAQSAGAERTWPDPITLSATRRTKSSSILGGIGSKSSLPERAGPSQKVLNCTVARSMSRAADMVNDSTAPLIESRARLMPGVVYPSPAPRPVTVTVRLVNPLLADPIVPAVAGRGNLGVLHHRHSDLDSGAQEGGAVEPGHRRTERVGIHPSGGQQFAVHRQTGEAARYRS